MAPKGTVDQPERGGLLLDSFVVGCWATWVGTGAQPLRRAVLAGGDVGGGGGPGGKSSFVPGVSPLLFNAGATRGSEGSVRQAEVGVGGEVTGTDGGVGGIVCQADVRAAFAGPLLLDDEDKGGVGGALAVKVVQPDFRSGVSAFVGALPLPLVVGIFTPMAFAILRSSFSSRRLSFSLRASASAAEAMRIGWLPCKSFIRDLWWCAYELVCSSYCATFLNCLSQSSQ